ncbi:MAG: response regulator [Gemmatimonadales bacterium]
MHSTLQVATEWGAPHVLIVDDEEQILLAMQDYFTAIGCEVTSAREVEEAEALLATTAFDVVLADLRLGGVHDNEGIRLLSFVKERGLPTRMVLMTAYGAADVEFEARRRGADLFLHKPIPLADLARRALRLIGVRT